MPLSRSPENSSGSLAIAKWETAKRPQKSGPWQHFFSGLNHPKRGDAKCSVLQAALGQFIRNPPSCRKVGQARPEGLQVHSQPGNSDHPADRQGHGRRRIPHGSRCMQACCKAVSEAVVVTTQAIHAEVTHLPQLEGSPTGSAGPQRIFR